MDVPPAAPSQRLVNILFLICSLSLPTAILLGGYLLYQKHEIDRIKAGLLAESALQAELLQSQPLDQTAMPHMVGEIGYVLNPFTKRSSLWAHEGDSYPVNSLGLRGSEIMEKRPGVKRILIVGDSIVFGWKLKEEDRLSSILSRRASKITTANQQLEFLTIALPGWNVRSGVAFLESHLLLLDPDLIIWWSIANDIEDTAGVIPPGSLACGSSTTISILRRSGNLIQRCSRLIPGSPAGK